jgi:ethanolamine utilization EutJ-like protein
VRTGEVDEPRGEPRLGIDLGTANIVLSVVDGENRPVAGAWVHSTVVRDGVVVDWAGATTIVRRLKDDVEQRLGHRFTKASVSIPPGISEGDIKVFRNVASAAGLDTDEVVDEPVAAARALGITDGCVIDIGHGTTGVSILSGSRVLLSVDEATGGHHMNLVLAGAYRIGYEAAEVMKKDPGQAAGRVRNDPPHAGEDGIDRGGRARRVRRTGGVPRRRLQLLPQRARRVRVPTRPACHPPDRAPVRDAARHSHEGAPTMTEAELRALIVDAILELMSPPPRRALVLFTGGLLGFDDAIGELKLLAADGVQLDYLQTPSAIRVLDQDKIRSVGMREVSKRMVEEHDMLIAPTLTSNIAAKVAHGVADCLASNLFSEFIMSNRLVVASRSAICPDDAPKRGWFPNMPPAYADLLRANLAALDSFGVRLSDSRFLYRTAIAAWERRDRGRALQSWPRSARPSRVGRRSRRPGRRRAPDVEPRRTPAPRLPGPAWCPAGSA